MKYIVVNMTTQEQILTATRRGGRELAEFLSIETTFLWFLMIVSEEDA